MALVSFFLKEVRFFVVRHVTTCLAAALIVVLAGCQAIPIRAGQAALSGQGEIYVYMERFPRPAARLAFDLDRIYAVKKNGSYVPLAPRASKFSMGLDGRQRLAAWGALAPGRYKGLAFKLKDASLTRAQGGKADMLVPQKPVVEGFPFTIKDKGAVVITISLIYGDSVKNEFSFTPGFNCRIPVKPVDAVLGYVVNYGSNDITVFNKSSMEVTGAIPTGAGPVSLVLNRSLKRAYVSISREDSIEVIDMVSDSVIGRIRLYPGDSPHELALTPDGKTLLAADTGSNTVSVIDPVSYIETSRISVGTRPVSMILDRAAAKAWVFNHMSSNISIIDTQSGAVSATLAADPVPLRGDFSRNGQNLYIINRGSPYLTVINPVSFALVQKKYMGPGMSAIKVDTGTDLIYIAKAADPYIGVYNPFTLTPEDYIQAGGQTRYMTIDNDDNNLCTVDSSGNALYFIDLASRGIRSKIDVGEDPVWVALVGER